MNAQNIQQFSDSYMRFPFDVINQQGFSAYERAEFPYTHAFFQQKADGSIDATQSTNKYAYTVGEINIDKKKEVQIIICVKNNPQILQSCLLSLIKYKATDLCDILVIDDRSENQENMDLAIAHGASYMRVDNEKDIFNYSILNNLGAAFSRRQRKQRIICWNSDMFPTSEKTISNLLDKHIKNKSALSGSKLLYPEETVYKSVYPNYDHVLGENLKHAYGTIQHGGIIYAPIPPAIKTSKSYAYHPLHHWRYHPADRYMANQDMPCVAVTGALHILELDTFIKEGGYGCSLASTFQDIDLCQRYAEINYPIWYLGSETLLHAETITMKAEANLFTAQYASDQLIYEYLWSTTSRLTNLLGIPTK